MQTWVEVKEVDFAAFAAALQTRLQVQLTERMVQPLQSFHAACQEKYGRRPFSDGQSATHPGHIDYHEMFADIRTRLGEAWETQVVTALTVSSQRVYNQCVELYNQGAAVQPAELVASMKQRLGCMWDERLSEPLAQWLAGAQAAAALDLKQVTAVLDYNQDGQVTTQDAMLAGKDLMNYLYTTSLTKACQTVQYLLPAPPQAEGQRVASFQDLKSIVSSRVNARVTEQVNNVKYTVNAVTTTAMTQVASTVEQIKELKVKGVGAADVLAYAETVIQHGQDQLDAVWASPVLKDAVEKAQTALTAVRVAVRQNQTKLAAQTAAVMQSTVATWVNRTHKAVTAARHYVAHMSHDLTDLSHTTVAFVAQGLGFQPKDDVFDEVLARLTALLTHVRQIVRVSAMPLLGMGRVAAPVVVDASVAAVVPMPVQPHVVVVTPKAKAQPSEEAGGEMAVPPQVEVKPDIRVNYVPFAAVVASSIPASPVLPTAVVVPTSTLLHDDLSPSTAAAADEFFDAEPVEGIESATTSVTAAAAAAATHAPHADAFGNNKHGHKDHKGKKAKGH